MKEHVKMEAVHTTLSGSEKIGLLETELRDLKEQFDALRETLRWYASERGFTSDEQDVRVRAALGE